MNIWRRFVRGMFLLGLIGINTTPVLLVILGIIFEGMVALVGILLAVPIYLIMAIWQFKIDTICDYSLSERRKQVNQWTRKGKFKTKSVEEMQLGVVVSNVALIRLILDTIIKIEKVFAMKGHPRKLKLSSGVIYALAGYGAIVCITTKRNSLIFNFCEGELRACNINNIFMLPDLNDELQGIIDVHNDSEQIEAQERKDTKDDYREYVKAISEMMN